MTEDLTRSDVRGGVNEDSGVQATAGTAEWYEPEQLPPRRSRLLNATQQSTGGAFARIVQAAQDAAARAVKADGSSTVTLGDQEVSRADLETVAAFRPDDVLAMTGLNELAAVSYLRSWTVQQVKDGVVVPLDTPKTVDDLVNLPRETYDDLMAVAGRIEAERRVRPGFTAESAADPDSPTDASGLSLTR